MQRIGEDRDLDAIDYNPFVVLEHFRFPEHLEYEGEAVTFSALMDNGSVEVTDGSGMRRILSAHLLRVSAQPLLDIARAASEDTRSEVLDILTPQQ